MMISPAQEEKVADREKDRMSTLFWTVLAVGICFGSVRLDLGELHKPGPGFFSFLAGAILGILSLIVFVQSFKSAPGDEKKPFWLNPQRRIKMAYLVVALILYAIGMNYIGFFFSTLLFLGFLLRSIDSQRWSVVLTVSILATIISYGIFQYWLDVQLPTGILPF
jgi:putative tricarboxylic transport membrane protein